MSGPSALPNYAQQKLEKTDPSKAPTPEEALNFKLANPGTLFRCTIESGLLEALIAFVIVIVVCSSYVLLDTVNARAGLSGVLFVLVFAVCQENFYVLPSTALSEFAVDCWRMKDKTPAKAGILSCFFALRVACTFLGAFASLYVLKSWYSDDTLKLKLAPFMWQDTSTLSRAAVFFVYALAHLVFNGLLFYFYYRTNVPNYVPKQSKYVFREEFAAVYRLIFPIVMGAVYYQLVVLFSNDIGDPLQFHIYLVLQALFGMHHATGLVVGACIVGAVAAMGVPLFINMQYNTNKTDKPGAEYTYTNYDLASRRIMTG